VFRVFHTLPLFGHVAKAGGHCDIASMVTWSPQEPQTVDGSVTIMPA